MNYAVRKQLKSITKTEATRFLLPMLGDKSHRDEFFVNKYFINAFIGDSNKPELDNHLVLQYHFVPTVKFIQFERELLIMKDIVADYDYDSNGTVMYVFKIPDEHQNDYVKFLQGRYSEFSIMYKLTIMKFWNLDDTALLSSILFRSNPIKTWWIRKGMKPRGCADNEYWPKPLIGNEVYYQEAAG